MRGIKGILVVFSATIFWGLWRFSLPIFKLSPPTILTESLGSSWFVRMNIHQPVLVIFALLVMTGFVYFFTRIQGGLTGSKVQKGIFYGICFALLWYIGFIGISFYFDTPLIDEMVSSLADSIPLLVSGIVAGLILGDDGQPIRFKRPKPFLPVILMGVIYTLVHSSTYFFVDHENIISRILFTPTNLTQLLIVVLIGTWLGVMFVYMKPGLSNPSSIKNLLLFSVGIFGTNWIAFNLFYNIFFDSIFLPSLGVALLDIVAVFFDSLLISRLKIWDNVQSLGEI